MALTVFVPENVIGLLALDVNFDGRMRLVQTLVVPLMFRPVQMVLDSTSVHGFSTDGAVHFGLLGSLKKIVMKTMQIQT
jgi:hypothetical protein